MFQFSGENSDKMKSAYGEFCSNHMDGVELYKVTSYTGSLLPGGFVCLICLFVLTSYQRSCPFLFCLVTVAGVRRGVKGERRAREGWEDRTREDRGRGPSPSRAHSDFHPPFLYGLPRRLCTALSCGKDALSWLRKSSNITLQYKPIFVQTLLTRYFQFHLISMASIVTSESVMLMCIMCVSCQFFCRAEITQNG